MSRGGPSKMTPGMEKRILRYISQGMSLRHVCETLNIDESTLRKHRKLHHEFSLRLKRACEQQEASLIRDIRSGVKNWQALAWLASKQHPHKYGRKVDEAAPVIQPVQIVFKERHEDGEGDLGTPQKATPLPLLEHEDGGVRGG